MQESPRLASDCSNWFCKYWCHAMTAADNIGKACHARIDKGLLHVLANVSGGAPSKGK